MTTDEAIRFAKTIMRGVCSQVGTATINLPASDRAMVLSVLSSRLQQYSKELQHEATQASLQQE